MYCSHAVSAYNLSSNMKIREHYIKFTGNINNTYIIVKSSNTLVCFENNYGSAILSVSVSLTTVRSCKEKSQMRTRRLLRKGFVQFWHWLNCLEILFFFSFDRFPLVLLIHASYRLRF